MIKLFLVEDHEIMRNTLISLLNKEEDFLVCGQASSGEEALERLPTLTPDMVLIDVSMPGMNGLTLLKEVQARWPDLPCLILSGHAASVYKERALKAGAIAYIEKNKVREIVPTIRRSLAEVAKGSECK